MSEQGSNQGEMIPGSDWSMGLNRPTSVSQAAVLVSLGGKLRTLYAELIAEGVPEHLARIVGRWKPGKPARAIRGPPRRWSPPSLTGQPHHVPVPRPYCAYFRSYRCLGVPPGNSTPSGTVYGPT